MPPLDLQITRGLSLFDCQDHHAILGVPINAETKVIRKRYLNIARKLHPDSVSKDVNKETASMVLSKLVNPSYEFLSQPSQMDEYNILLKLVGQRYAQEQHRFQLLSREAKELMQTSNLEQMYHTCITELANHQFSSLNRYLEITGTLSEVNLAYLYRQEGVPVKTRPSGKTTPARSSPSRQSNPSQPPESRPPSKSSAPTSERTPAQSKAPPSEESGGTVNYNLVNQYYRRAEELIGKACYLEAIRELKEVVEGNNPIDPNNSRVYTLLGNIYKDRMKQPVMARPFYTKAIRSDPDNSEARQKLASITPSTPRAAKSTAKEKAPEADKKRFGFLNFLSRNK